jgi:hypothetical protein
MVARQLREAAVAQHVDAAVAGPHAGILMLEGQQGGQRRADRAGLARSRDRSDLAIGQDHPVLEARAKIGRRTRNADRLQVLDDAGAGDLARIVAAHAVGDGEHAAVGLHQVAVLVEIADPSGMRHAAAVDVEHGPVHGASSRPVAVPWTTCDPAARIWASDPVIRSA